VEITSGGGSKDGAIRDFKECRWKGRVRCTQVKTRLEEAGAFKHGRAARSQMAGSEERLDGSMAVKREV
jgi:hypothetical protein